MFAHKLCALLDRTEVTGRDIFDCWFFLQSHTPVNAHIIEQRMNQNLSDYIDRCIEQLEHTSDKIIMSGLGELADTKTKGFVKNKLRLETIQLLQMFKAFPDVAE